MSLFLIDTDAGVDDAMALLMLLRGTSSQVLGVIASRGNAQVEDVARNVQRVLQLDKGRLKPVIPVFPGSSTAFQSDSFPEDLPKWFGLDGFNGAIFPEEEEDLILPKTKETAVEAIVRIVKENPGSVTYLALAPLTNLALALSSDPSLASKLNKLIIMGGNSDLINTEAQSPELNFRADARAANFVLQIVRCPVVVVPAEACQKVEKVLKFSHLRFQSSPSLSFFRRLSTSASSTTSSPWPIFDQVAAAVAIDPTALLISRQVSASVQESGQLLWTSERTSNVRLALIVCSQTVNRLIHTALDCEQDVVLTFYFRKPAERFLKLY